MFKRFEQMFGVDLGTCNTLIYQQGNGIVLREPSVVAIRKDTGQIEAFGEEAYAMIGRTPANLEVIHPLKEGVVANFDMAAAMLKHFISKVQGRYNWFRGSQVYISVRCGITEVQKRAVENMVVHKGSKRSVTIEEPLAAAIGAGLPISDPIGNMVVDIGGGTSQVALISLGGIVVSQNIRLGGMSIDRDIIEYVKKTYNVIIGERTAEEIKKTIASAVMPEADIRMDIRGNDLVAGLPITMSITSKEIYEIFDHFSMSIVESIRQTMEQCPPELAGDLMERGILLCGGGALLQGLDQRLQQEIGVPVHLAEFPMECIAQGAGRMLSFKAESIGNYTSSNEALEAAANQ
ncbi:rod shape-determining protein [Paenibacillus agricola]|uniref:Cell shape-determining protein MreB n=1 Tax=Paenibacillus agricola TaxID=2716264 RepID=A0ABX0J179_9BACL|nr:rod shape-determining protein [Paenibacillus agricola]NHN29586.1 rod shape-determining protein [Paenibacillus agricola]